MLETSLRLREYRQRSIKEAKGLPPQGWDSSLPWWLWPIDAGECYGVHQKLWDQGWKLRNKLDGKMVPRLSPARAGPQLLDKPDEQEASCQTAVGWGWWQGNRGREMASKPAKGHALPWRACHWLEAWLHVHCQCLKGESTSDPGESSSSFSFLQYSSLTELHISAGQTEMFTESSSSITKQGK